jgi:AcrR family transcriptional regulator
VLTSTLTKYVNVTYFDKPRGMRNLRKVPRKLPNTDKREPYHHGDLRAHLIETVRQLVEQKGVDGFSISQAARIAGVSSAAPYKHFSDKMEIVRAVALEGMHRLGAAMRDAAQGASATKFGKIDAIGKAYVDFARAEPGVFRLMFGLTETHTADPEIMCTGLETYGILLQEVAAALPEGTNETDIQRRSYLLWSFVHGHSFLQIDGKVDARKMAASEDELLAELSQRVLGS